MNYLSACDFSLFARVILVSFWLKWVPCSGDLHQVIYRVGRTTAVRLSVSLLSCNLISGGDGSANNPYIVKTDGSSC